MLSYSHEHIFSIQPLLDRDLVATRTSTERKIRSIQVRSSKLLVSLEYLCIYRDHPVEHQCHFDVWYSRQAKMKQSDERRWGETIRRTLFCALRNFTSYLSVFRFSSLICSSISRSEFYIQSNNHLQFINRSFLPLIVPILSVYFSIPYLNY